MALHVVLGGVYLVLAPLQFVRRIRTRHLGYHRWVGRVLVAIGLVVGATALFMGLVIPFSGWIERGYIGLFGGLFLVALIKGFVHVRAGRVALHREWMIRAFAVGLAVSTQRLIFIPALLVVADPTQGQLQSLSAAAFLASDLTIRVSSDTAPSASPDRTVVNGYPPQYETTNIRASLE